MPQGHECSEVSIMVTVYCRRMVCSINNNGNVDMKPTVNESVNTKPMVIERMNTEPVETEH